MTARESVCVAVWHGIDTELRTVSLRDGGGRLGVVSGGTLQDRCCQPQIDMLRLFVGEEGEM